MYPVEAVLSHIEMYCDFTEVSLQEGSVSCAINHVVCTITKCCEQHTGWANRWNLEWSVCAVCVRLNSETWLIRINRVFFLFVFFLSDFMDNVTLSYAYFLFLKLLWYTSTVQHKETQCWCFDSQEKEVFCLAVPGINCMFKHWNSFPWN